MKNSKMFFVGAVASCLLVTMNSASAQFFNAAKEAGFGASLTLGATFTDNRDQTSNVGREHDSDLTVGLKLSYERIFENRYKFYFDYRPSYVFHDNPGRNSERNALEHEVNAKLELTPGRRTLLRFSDRFWWSGNKNWNFGDDAFADPTFDRDDFNDKYVENRFSGHMQYNFSEKNYMLLDAFIRNRRYDEDHAASNHDEDEYNARLAIMRSPTRYYSLGFFGDFTSFNRDSTLNYDFDVDYFNVGIQVMIDFFADERWVLNASTGYNFMFYEDVNMNDTSMFGDSRLELVIHQRELLRGKIGMRYSKDYSSVVAYSSERNFVSYGSISRIFGRNNAYTAGADLEFRLRNYDKDDIAKQNLGGANIGDNERDTFFLRFYLNAKITEGLSASVFYSYEDTDSDLDVYKDFQENVFGIRFTYDFL